MNIDKLPQNKLYRMKLIDIKDKIDYDIDTLQAYLSDLDNIAYTVLSKKNSWLSVQDNNMNDIDEDSVLDDVSTFIKESIIYEKVITDDDIPNDDLFDTIKENIDVFYDCDIDTSDGINIMTIEIA